MKTVEEINLEVSSFDKEYNDVEEKFIKLSIKKIYYR